MYSARLFFFISLVLLLAYACFVLGVNGPFLLDDYHNLSPSSRYGGVLDKPTLLHFLFGSEGDKISRSFARLTFLLDDNAWPSNPIYYKPTNILLHIVNGLLVFLVSYRFLAVFKVPRVELGAFLIMALWVLNPLHVSTVLYIVQRMTLLSTMFSLVSIYMFLLFYRYEKLSVQVLLLAGLGLAMLLGVFSKENAVMAIPIMALIGYFAKYKGISNYRLVDRLMMLAVVVFTVLFVFAVLKRVDGYESRSFTMFERIGIQSYVLILYVYYWLFGWVEGIGLHHDDIEYIVENYNVLYFYPLWLMHAGVLYFAYFYRNKNWLVFFGVCWFYIGHIMESTFLPLELMFEHRNYFPSIGLCLVLFAFLMDFYKRKPQYKLIYLAVVTLAIGLNVIFLAKRAKIWSDEYMMNSKWAYESPNSRRAQIGFVELMNRAGFYKTSISKLREVSENSYDLGIQLDKIRLICISGDTSFESDYVNVDEIAASVFRTNIVHSFKLFIAFKDAECADGFLLNGTRRDLIENVGRIAGLKKRKAYYALYADELRKFYQERRDYAGTVKAVEALYNAQPTIATALRATETFLSGGDLENARVYLGHAKRLNSSRWYSDRTRDLEIERLDYLITRLQNVD